MRPLFIVLLLATTALVACSSGPVRERYMPEERIAETLENAAAPAPPPEAVNNALLPGMGLDIPAPGELRFDVNVNGAPADTFFMSLVQGTPYNVIVHPEVEGRISLSLKNVTVPEVMKLVRGLYGYAWQRTGNNYLVLPATIQTRIFEVDYLNFVREGESKVRVSSGQATQVPRQGVGLYGGGYAQGAAAGDDANTASTRIVTKTETDFWTVLETNVKKLIGTGKDRTVVVNPQAGLVAVTAMPAELRSVANYLQSLQDNVLRQVVIEAKFIEVELSDSYQSGINWWALSQAANGILSGGMISSNELVLNGENPSFPITIEPGGTAVGGFDTTTIGGVFAMAYNSGDFAAFIELLETQGDTHVLSSPRVTAMNNQKAVIKVGSDEFFVTGIRSNSTLAGAGATSGQNIELTPFFSGIALDVTPQIGENGEIMLHIHPSITEVREQEKAIQFAGSTQRLPLAFSTVREADTLVRAESGQIIVIGGLMRTSTETQTAGVPLLSDIPILGYLFRNEKQVQRKSELVILLKPVVVDSDEVWRDMVRESSLRLFGPDGPDTEQPDGG